MMARIYTNENMPQAVVLELRRLGHDVLTTHESGRSGQAISDEAVLAFAAAEARVLVTLNRKHFIRLHQDQPNHAGIIMCSFDLDYAALAERVSAGIQAYSDLSGVLARINRPG
jgi:hypothetical protein